MKAKHVLGPLVAAALLAAPSVAVASDVNNYPGKIEEHNLHPADSFTPGPDLTDGDIYWHSEELWIQDHLLEGFRYTDPFIAAPVYPRVSASTLLTAESDTTTKAIAYNQSLDLNLYWLQLRLPIASAVDFTSAPLAALDANLLLPYTLNANNRFGLLLGTSIPYHIVGAAFQGYRAQVVYGGWIGPFDGTLRVGYGVVPINGLAGGTPSSLLTYGGTAAWAFTDWVRLVAEVDGSHAAGGSDANVLSIAPGFRFFPNRNQTLNVGVAALLSMTEDETINFGVRSAGGLLTVGYTFL
jgi:hypothetical protein